MRLGFSIATNVDPDILLIDEVLSVGDASFVPKCIDKINEFKRRGKTIIFVSHDLATVERISDEVIWLKDGKIQMQGYPKRVTDAYLEYIGKRDEKEAGKKHKAEEMEAEKNREKRWGAKEIEISKVKMIDKNGNEKYIFEQNEPFTIEFNVNSKTEEKDFVFGIGVFNTEGVQCYGSNTLIEDFKSQSIKGKGKIRINISNINLVNGTYFLDLAVHKRDGYPFDYHHFQYTFKITSIYRDIGIARISHKWEFSKNIKIHKKSLSK